MKKNLLFILFAHITTLGFSQVDWVPTNGPYGGGVLVLKNINNKVYAGTDCGIYSTIDNGITWENKSAGLNGECKWIYDIEVLGNTLIASSKSILGGSIQDGIFLSYDSGNTWTQSNTGLIDPNGYVQEINDIFVNGSDILIGTLNGVYKSINQGLSWNPSNIGINELGYDNAFQFTKNGSNIFLHVNSNIYKSTDNGFTWVNLNSPFYCNSIVSFGGSIYAGTSNQGVYKTSNNGISWTLLNFNFPSTPLQIKYGGTKLYCASDSQTFESTDGISWSIVPHMGASGTNDNNILEVNNKVFWGGGDGVYSRSNGSSSVINSGLGGSSKTNVIFHDGNTMYAGSWNGIYKSTDNGNIWNNLGLTLPLNSIVNCITKSGSNLVIGTKGNGVYLSNDNGNTWTQSNNGLNINGVIYSNVTSLFHFNGRLFMGAMENINSPYATLFISDNNGVSWTQSATGLGPKSMITSICNFQQYIIIAVAQAGTGTPGVYLSVDNGLSWLLDNPGYPVNLVCANSTSIFAVNFEYVFSTINIGNSWTATNQGSGNLYIKTIANLNNSIYLQWANCIYKIIDNIWIPFSGGNGLAVDQYFQQSYRTHLSSNQSGTIFIGERSIVPYGGGYYPLNNGVSKYVGVTNDLNEIQNKINYSISPNPTTSKITVKSSLELIGKEFTIYDQLGKEVMSGIITSEDTEIDLSNISEGVYLFKVGEEMQETFRIIKQ